MSTPSISCCSNISMCKLRGWGEGRAHRTEDRGHRAKCRGWRTDFYPSVLRPPPSALLAALPGWERPDYISAGRVPGPDRIIVLVQDLHQHGLGIDVLMGLGIELYSLPRVDKLVARDVGFPEGLHYCFRVCGLGPVDGVGQHEGRPETAGRVL